jgi:hypothetical protein
MKKTVISAILVLTLFISAAAQASLFENKKIMNALENDKVRVGMTKQELISEIGYPPEGKPKQDALYYRFVQTKVTAAGKEESWTYQIGATPGGVRSVTFKILDGKIQEWNEWMDNAK